MFISNSVNGQIKISDKKSAAYKESRKNKNKKKKERRKRYRNASIQNQTSGELEVVPEALQERYVPKKQNAEKNPSRTFSQSKRKQKKNYTKKANESKRQGMVLKDTNPRRQKKYKKQSKKIVQHQGNIRVEPYVLRSRQGFFPQTPVDDTPGRTNVRKRNEKLAQYSQKSEEALMQGLSKSKSRKQIQAGTLEKSMLAQSQGLYRVKSKRKQDSQIRRNSNKAATNKGNLSLNRSRKDDTYMAKSVEGLNQGMTVKSKKVRDRKQVMQSKSMAQSQFQGNLKYNAKNRDDQYMIKSIEAQKQGLVIKKKSLRDRKQIMQSNSMAQSQYQGNLKYNAKNREDQYMIKSREAQNQGLVIKNKSLRDRKQLMQSNSMAQSQYQGNLKFNAKKRDDLYMIKSIEAQNQGLVIKNKSLRDRKQLMQSNSMAQSQYQGDLNLNKLQKDDIYMAKSVEMQSAGLTIKRSDRKKEAMYIRKSIEASNVGLYKVRGDINKEDIYMGKSVEMMSQGLYKGQSIQDRESQYIRKSIEILNAGLFKTKSKSAKESQLKKKSNEAMSYSGDLKYISERQKEARLKKASSEIFAYKGDFKVQRRLFERIHYKRLSTKHRKFEGMDQESRFEHWWASLWKRPMDQKKKPEPLRKPRYDSKEHEIWFD